MKTENIAEMAATEAVKLLIETQTTLRYHLLCASTEQVPFLNLDTADLLRRIEQVTGVVTPRPAIR